MSLLHAATVELEHRLAIVWLDSDGFRRLRALCVRSADVDGHRPVLAHRGVVDVDAEVIVWSSADRKAVRVPQSSLSFCKGSLKPTCLPMISPLKCRSVT